MIEPVDLGICSGCEWQGEPSRTAVVLPGAMLGGAPSCHYAALTLFEAGWRVIQVWDTYDRSMNALEWAVSRTEAALDYAGAARLMVAKSATTLAAGVAADRRLAGIWLTPLLAEAPCADGLRARTGRALAIGGTADESWDGALARELADDVLELDGADHGLAKIEHLPQIVDAVSAFAARVA